MTTETTGPSGAGPNTEDHGDEAVRDPEGATTTEDAPATEDAGSTETTETTETTEDVRGTDTAAGSSDDAAPPGPPASVAAAPDSSGGRGGRQVALVPVLVIIALLVVLVLAATAVGVGGLGRSPEASAPPPPTPAGPPADTGPPGPPTFFGRVVAVNDPASIVVDVAGRPTPVSVLGIDAATIPGCATPAALDFARSTLGGQEVTLVPDPTLPPVTGGPTRAYAVLGTQSSYTDAAITAGHATASGPSRYRAVFDQEQARAQQAGVGMWGPPCVP